MTIPQKQCIRWVEDDDLSSANRATTSFPIRLLTATLALTMAVLLAMSWSAYDSYRHFVTMELHDLRLAELRGTIVRLDEVLTMSARMAATTGDSQWERRYRQFKTPLDDAVDETMRLTKQEPGNEAARQTNEANLKLVEMENQAFALVRIGRAADAEKVLFSETYEAQKKIYAAGVATLIQDIKAGLVASQHEMWRRAVLVGAIALLSLGLLVMTWLKVLARLQQWRTALAQAAAALSSAHANLEKRVQERTTQLQAEVSEHERTEEALRESKRFAESIAENSTSLIYLIDLETGRNTYASRDIAAHLGYSPAQIEVLGANPMPGLIHTDDWPLVVRHFAQFADVRDSRVVDLEYRVKHASGDWRWIWARDTVFHRRPDGSARQVMGTAQDITERKRAEADLEATHKAFVETSRQAGMAEIATNVLHNVGNILNSVNVSAALVSSTLRTSRAQGLTQAIRLMDEHAADLGEFLTLDEKGRLLPGYLNGVAQALAQEQQRMIAELAHLNQSIDHIKSVVATQQSYAGGSSVIEPVQICELVEDALRMNGGALVRHGVTVIKQFAKVPEMRLDRARVLQILVNLISNASNAMENMPAESNQITLTVDPMAGTNLRVSVKDGGDGIPAQNLTRIFGHGFTTRKAGHGFGLHSCALAARQMGGTLTAHSDGPGLGATFTLELPIHPMGPNISQNGSR